MFKVCVLNYKTINTIHVCFISILRYVYIILYKKTLKVLQIYLYDVNIYFELGLDEF